jgi:DNA-binding IclR family transcriptional regulator
LIQKVRDTSTNQKALDILDCFSLEKQELGITEIAKIIGYGKSTVYAIVKTLEKNRYLKQNNENKKYSLGLKIIERAYVLLEQMDIRKITFPFLKKLSEKYKENVHLAILDRQEVVYIEKFENAPSLGIRSWVGHRTSVHSTALGKVILAFLPEEEINKIIQIISLEKRTPNTITDPSVLKSHLSQVKKVGYAIDNEEHQVGGICIGGPIFDCTGKVIAAFSISVPIVRINKDKLGAIIEDIIKTSKEISAELGYKAGQ